MRYEKHKSGQRWGYYMYIYYIFVVIYIYVERERWRYPDSNPYIDIEREEGRETVCCLLCLCCLLCVALFAGLFDKTAHDKTAHDKTAATTFKPLQTHWLISYG